MVAMLFIFLFLFFASGSEAAEVYLKNGSVIKGVTSYTLTGGKVILKIYGGTVEIPEKEVLKIEEKEPVEKETREEIRESPREDKYVPYVEPSKPEAEMDRARLQKIEERLDEINKEEEAFKGLNKEYKEVRFIIEVLFQNGRNRALAAGQAESQWLNFLNPQERQWVQMNTLRKGELEREMEKMEKKLIPLRRERDSLLEKKALVESRIKPLK